MNTISDVTGDSRDDLILSLGQNISGPSRMNRVRLGVFDPMSPGSPVFTFDGPDGSIQSSFGYTAVVGDIFNNGHENILVGAAQEVYSPTSTGTVRLYSIAAESVSPIGLACGNSGPRLAASLQGNVMSVNVQGGPANSLAVALLGCTPELPTALDSVCTAYVGFPLVTVPTVFLLDASGNGSSRFVIANFSCSFPGYLQSKIIQAGMIDSNGGLELSDGIVVD